MSKIKLKEIADAIREKDGTTEPIVANDFATRIRAISGSEDLTTELNTQDGLLTNLETEINSLPEAGGTTPTGTLEITENGEYDVTEYASANVNVADSSLEQVTTLKNKLKGIIDGTITELTAEDFEGVEAFRYNAISYCRSLTKVVIPEGITTIPSQCFYYDSAIEYCELPSTITAINIRGLLFTTAASSTKNGVIRVKATVPPTINARNQNNGSLPYSGNYFIEVPPGTLDTYLSDTNWITYHIDNGGTFTFVEYEEE